MSQSEAAYFRVFGEALRPQRARPRISQEELGFEAGFDRTYVSGIERGVRNPTPKTVRRIGAPLGTRASQLLVAAEEGE